MCSDPVFAVLFCHIECFIGFLYQLLCRTRLFDQKGNDIRKIDESIGNGVGYVMKYINKTLPLSKREALSEKEEYLNAWYSHHRIVRFSASRSLAPLRIYRLLHHRFSLRAVTKLHKDKHLTVYTELESDKIMEIFDGDELLYIRRSDDSLERVRTGAKMVGVLQEIGEEVA